MSSKYTPVSVPSYQWDVDDFIEGANYSLSSEILDAYMKLRCHSSKVSDISVKLIFLAAITKNSYMADAVLGKINMTISSIRKYDPKCERASLGQSCDGEDVYKNDCYICYKRIPYDKSSYQYINNHKTTKIGDHISNIQKHRSIMILSYIIINREFIPTKDQLLDVCQDQQDSPDYIELLMAAYQIKNKKSFQGAMFLELIYNRYLYTANSILDKGLKLKDAPVLYCNYLLSFCDPEATKPIDSTNIDNVAIDNIPRRIRVKLSRFVSDASKTLIFSSHFPES